MNILNARKIPGVAPFVSPPGASPPVAQLWTPVGLASVGLRQLPVSATFIFSPMLIISHIVFALLASLTLLTATTSAGQPVVSAFVSEDSVQVVEPFTLNISVQADQGAKVNFPELQNRLGVFEIRDIQDAFDVPDAHNVNLRNWTRTLTLESVDTGDLHIPPLNLQVTQGGSTTQLTTQPIAVRVASVLEDRSDPTKFRDIQSVVDVPLPEPPATRGIPWAAVATLSLLGLALCVGAIAYRRRQRITPQTWALRQIEALNPDSPKLAEQLSQIIHEFLMLQFEMPDTGSLGRGRSAQEIVQSLFDQHRIEALVAERVRALVDLTDQAKFAGLRLSPEETKSAIADARELVISLALPPSGRSGIRQNSQ